MLPEGENILSPSHGYRRDSPLVRGGLSAFRNYTVIARPENGVPEKRKLFGERRSQDTGGIFRLRKMEHGILRFDDVAIRIPQCYIFFYLTAKSQFSQPPGLGNFCTWHFGKYAL